MIIKPGMEFSVHIETITPELARYYLSLNTDNYRPVNKGTLQRYITEMKNKSWQTTGESITFYKRGVLKDGQHRLMACVESGEAFQAVVVVGIPDDATIADRGRARTTRETLAAASYSGDVIGNTATSAIWALITGSVITRIAVASGLMRTYYDKTPNLKLWETAASCVNAGPTRGKLTRRGNIAVAAYLLLKNGFDENVIKEFFDVVNRGVPNKGHDCSSALVLRRMLQSTVARGKDRELIFSATISAINDYAAGAYRKKNYTLNERHIKWLRDESRIECAELGIKEVK